MRNFKVYFSLALVMVMLLLTGTSVPAATVSNLIVNGDYEGEGHGWIDTGSSFAEGITVVSDVVYSGSGALKAEKTNSSTDKYADDSIEVVEGHTYLFSGYYKYNKPSGAGEYDGVFLRIENVRFPDSTATAKNLYLSNSGEGWNYFSQNFTANTTGETLALKLGVDTGIPVGTITYFDDVQLIDLTVAMNDDTFDGAMEEISAWETTDNVSLETGTVQRGEGSLKIAGIGSAMQTSPVTSAAYKLKGCVKTGENYVAGDAKIKIYDGTNKNQCLFTYDVTGNSAWTGIEIDAISCTSGIVTVELSNKGAADIFFDNFKLDQSDNLIPNPGFEGEMSANVYGATKSNANAHGGSYSYTGITTTSTGITMNFNKIPCEPETEYTFSFYQYARDTKYTIVVYQVTENGAEISLLKSTSGNDWITDNTWKKTTLDFKTSAETNFIKVQISYAKRNDTVYVDDLSLTKLGASETEFRKDGKLLYELTAGEQAITSNYAVELAEEGSALYVVAFYEINKTSGVRTLQEVQMKDYPELTAGEHQLSDTITVTVGDTAQNRYELKAYALKGLTRLNPYDVYNNVRSN